MTLVRDLPPASDVASVEAPATPAGTPGPTPEEWARRWTIELTGARKELEKWHNQAAKIIKRFLDEREFRQNGDTRWNLFSANVQIQRAMMYGQAPRVSVSRRNADAQDDAARVAGTILERVLNTDIQRDSDTYADAVGHALDDRLLVGFGNARIRYVARFERVTVEAMVDPATGMEVAAGYEEERKVFEDVETDYVHWKDQLWGASRVFGEVPWWAFRAPMTRAKLVERFGELGSRIPLNSKRMDRRERQSGADPWDRADVWEIWSKEHRQVFWFVEGFDRILDVKDDPLGLEGFWPFPRPMAANLTTDALVPRPDFVLAQDLYDEIDDVSTRITLLEQAISVSGVYDQSAGEVSTLLTSGRNQLIPVAGWAAFAEKGGLRGTIDWLPLEQIVSALTSLRDYRRELIEALHQVTGMSDILRGQAATPNVTATEQRIKAGFGSVRMQALQDEFARFASDLQRLKAEVMRLHFEPQTLLERSNIMNTPDAQLAQAAVALIKERGAEYRVEVKPEAVSLTDFASLRAERTEAMTAIAGFLSSVMPLATQMPPAMPFFLQLLQWCLAGIRGASSMESVLDQAIAQAQQAAKQPAQAPAPDPKVIAAQMKAAADMQKIQAELQADLVRTQAEVQADSQREENQARWNVREAAQKALVTRAMSPRDPFRGGVP